jgi:UDP-glucose 4-epimerase
MNILLTGVAGYIGSHTYCELIGEDHNVIIFDNFSNSEKSVLKRLELITKKPINYVEGDILDSTLLRKTLSRYKVEAVIHFAGLKAVGESVNEPLRYYENNVAGTINLLKALQAAKVCKFVFSSSATVYGNPEYLPIDEEHPLNAINPYGRTKLQIETILKDFSCSNFDMKIAILRYFNPSGAHHSGLIGENPKGVPNNLVPYMMQVANHQLPFLKVYGDNYQTPDGSGIRDYIHVTDLALGHVKALHFMNSTQTPINIFNLGTGKGSSVLEVIQAFNKACGVSVPFKVEGKRDGDVAACYAKNEKAKKVLNWQPVFSLEDMIKSAWKFQQKNKIS